MVFNSGALQGQPETFEGFDATSNSGRIVLVVELSVRIYQDNSAVQVGETHTRVEGRKGPGRRFCTRSAYVSGKEQRGKHWSVLANLKNPGLLDGVNHCGAFLIVSHVGAYQRERPKYYSVL